MADQHKKKSPLRKTSAPLGVIDGYRNVDPLEVAVSPMAPFDDFVIVLLKPDAMSSQRQDALLRQADVEVCALARTARLKGRAKSFDFIKAYAEELTPHGIKVFADIRGFSAWAKREETVPELETPVTTPAQAAAHAAGGRINSPEHALWQVLRQQPAVAAKLATDLVARQKVVDAIALVFKLNTEAVMCGRRGELPPAGGVGSREEQQKELQAVQLLRRYGIAAAELPYEIPPWDDSHWLVAGKSVTPKRKP